MTQLISLPEIKDFLSIKTLNTEEDGRLSNIAVQVSSLVSSYCGRTFEAANYVEYFDGGKTSVFVANPPINRVDEVAHYDGNDYLILGAPDSLGQPIVKEGRAHSIALVGNPTLKTRVKQFGRSSVRLDGSSYLTASSDEDWDLGVDTFTLEVFARFDEAQGTQTLISSGSGSNTWSLRSDFDSHGLQFQVVQQGQLVCNVSQGSNIGISPNQFYHIAVSRQGSSFKVFRDGTLVANTTSSVNIANYGTGVDIGKYMTGYLDSLRISHDAKYASAFSAPTYPLPADSSTKLLVRFDGSNNSSTIYDLSRTVNEYAFYPVTGEISFDTGDGGGTPELGFFRPLKFRNYPKGVRVDYNGGFASIPDDLKLAVLEMVKVIYKGRSGSERVSFQGESQQTFKLSVDEFPPQVRRVLNLYRLIG